jgi:hypothetical protein
MKEDEDAELVVIHTARQSQVEQPAGLVGFCGGHGTSLGAREEQGQVGRGNHGAEEAAKARHSPRGQFKWTQWLPFDGLVGRST